MPDTDLSTRSIDAAPTAICMFCRGVLVFRRLRPEEEGAGQRSSGPAAWRHESTGLTVATRAETCTSCRGAGEDVAWGTQCRTCGGTGAVLVDDHAAQPLRSGAA